MHYDAIVIGAGNGGLTGALTLCKAGKKVVLLEKHNIPGGYATSFRRGRFEFEAALHQLYGITDTYDGKKGRLREIFETLDVWDKIEFVEQKETFRLVMGDKVDVALPVSHDGFVKKLQEISPEDAEAIEEYQNICDVLAEEVDDIYEAMAENAPITKERFPNIFKYGTITGKEMLDKSFKSPIVKGVFQTLYGYIGIPMDKISLLLLACVYARGEGTVHVKGGSQAMSNAIADEFIECGGKIVYNTKVDKIIVENNKVTGVQTDSGQIYTGDIILSNANKLNVYVDMVEEKYVPEEVFDDLRVSAPSRSIFGVYLGLDCAAENAGIKNATNFLLPSPEKMAQNTTRYDVDIRQLSSPAGMLMSCYNIDDPDCSPEGTCLVSLIRAKTPEPWYNVTENEYHNIKMEYAEEFLEYFYSVYPKARGHVEEYAIATPLTFMRYANAPEGAIYGLDPHFKDLISNKLEVDSPIKGLYFCGASVGMGGFNVTLMSGYSAARRILKDLEEEGK